MNDTKFLGLCILLAALMISASVIWCTKVNLDAMAALSPASAASGSASAVAGSTSITISGPVTLAPFSAPIPVTISMPDGNPIPVRDVTEKQKQWTR
jgi:hypothetical protein